MNTIDFSLTVLVVDDNDLNIEVLAACLNHHRYRVQIAMDGPSALSSVRGAPPDIIFLDIMMPNMSGFEVCARLKADARTAQIPVVFLSGLSDVQDQQKAFELGGRAYLTKPFRFDEIQRCIETIVTAWPSSLT